MAKDAADDWTSRESISITDMRTILGATGKGKIHIKDADDIFEAFAELCRAGLYIKDADDVLEAFAELCRGREQVVRGVKKLDLRDGRRVGETDLSDRGLLALLAILEAGHFSDVRLVAISSHYQAGGQKLWHLLGSGRLNDLRSLRLTDGGGEVMEALAKALQSSPPSKLEVLFLDGCLWDDEAVNVLADTIASGHLSSLLQLTLERNLLGAEAATSLGKSLCSGHLNKLETLHLRNMEFGDAGFESLAQAFTSGHLDSVRELDLLFIFLGAEGAKSLCKSFSSGHWTQLETLGLGHNQVGDAGVESLAEAFVSGHLDSLQELRLSGNSIGAEGAESLGKSFRSGHLNTLKTLDLSMNDLKDVGVESLATSLGSGNGNCSKLENLDLSRNGVGDVGVEALAQALYCVNYKNLRVLNLSHNLFGRVGLVALMETLKSGCLIDLKTIDLGGNSFFDSDIIEIARLLETGSLGGLESLYLFRSWSDLRRHSPEVPRALFNSYQKNTNLVISLCGEGGEDNLEDDRNDLNILRNLNKARVARLRALQDEDEEEVSGEHGKVFFCGNPGVGKTTLRTTLTKGRTTINSTKRRATLRSTLMKGVCGPICGCPKQEERDEREEQEKQRAREATRGIEVSNLHDEGSSTGVRPVTLALWDMAGQHDYEVLHSAFLPDLNFAGGQATFFVIVCNANNGGNTPQTAKNHLVYWLRFISSNSIEDMDVKQRRRVFVIFNCFQGDTSGHEKDHWTSFLVQCKATFGRLLSLNEEPIIIDVMNQTEVDHFNQILVKEARAMLANRKMPKICHAVEEDCREWAKEHEKYPVLKWHEYFVTVGKGRWEEEKLRAAAEYLHEAGHLILFRRQAYSQTSESQGAIDLDSTRTQETLVIMDPRWFCQDVVGNLLLPHHLVREDEALRNLRRGQSQKLRINVVKKFIFETPQVPSDKIDEVMVLLSRIGLCYQLPSRPHEIFIPALIEGNDEPDWSMESRNKEFDDGVWVMGFSLLVENPEATLLPIAVLRRLQVDLALDANFGRKPDSDFLAGKSCIKFKCKGMDVLVQYPIDPSTLESKQDRIDVLVKPVVDDSDPLMRKQQTNLAQQIVRRILNVVIFSCRGVKLDQRIIKPWSVNKGWKPVGERDIEYSVHDLKRRVEDNGELQKMEWLVGNERVEEEDVLSEEDLVGFRDLIAAKLIHTEDAVNKYGLSDSDLVEPSHVSDEGRKPPEFSTELTTGNSNDADSRILELLTGLARQMQRGFLSQKRGFREVKEALDDNRRLLEDIKRSIRVISNKQQSLNFQIQNLERFSVEEKERAIPRFAYLAEKGEDKWWIRVKERVVETKYLHFLCEAQFGKKTFHEVDGQEGIDVRKMKDWAKTLVPILGWTLKIGFVAAKIAGNVVLPGLGLLLDGDPLFNAISVGTQMAQGAIDFSKCLEEALGTAIDHDSLLSGSLGEGSNTGVENSKWVRGRERQLRGDARTAVHTVLEDLTQAEMKRQVGLRKVWLDVEGHSEGHVLWICEECFEKHGSRAHEIFK